MTLQIVLIRPAIAVDDLVFVGFLDEIRQPLLEFFRAVSCRINISDADPFIGFGEGLIVFPCGFVLFDRGDDVFGKDEAGANDSSDRLPDARMNQALGIQHFEPLDVQLRIGAAFSSGRKSA